MLGAGLLAKKAVERGLKVPMYVKTSLALAGHVDIDMTKEPIGKDKSGKEVFLRDLWPTPDEIREAMRSALKPEVFRQLYKDFAEQNPQWNEIPSTVGEVYQWDEKSTYI